MTGIKGKKGHHISYYKVASIKEEGSNQPNNLLASFFKMMLGKKQLVKNGKMTTSIVETCH